MLHNLLPIFHTLQLFGCNQARLGLNLASGFPELFLQTPNNKNHTFSDKTNKKRAALGCKNTNAALGCKKKAHVFRVLFFFPAVGRDLFFRLGVLHDAMEAPSSTLGVHREKSPVAGADCARVGFFVRVGGVLRGTRCVELKSGRGLWWGGELKGWWVFCGVFFLWRGWWVGGWVEFLGGCF